MAKTKETAAQSGKILAVKKQVVKGSGRNFKIPTDNLPGTGRRKRSIARVWLVPTSKIAASSAGRVAADSSGDGRDNFLINDRQFTEFFPVGRSEKIVKALVAPFKVAGLDVKNYKVVVNVKGGGVTGQVDAITMGIARDIAGLGEMYRYAMRKKGFLTRDERRVEPKKIGFKKARKSKQFSKR